MTDRLENQEIAELIDAVIDGRSDEAQSKRLDDLLESDAAARRYYVEHMALLTQIEHSTFESADALAHTVTPAEDNVPMPAQRKRNWAFRHPQTASITAAALVTVAAIVATSNIFVSPRESEPGNDVADSSRSREPEVVAKLTNWHNAVWLEDSRPPLRYPELKIGKRLVIESGLIEVTYLTGVQVVIQGPAEFELVGEKNGFLEHGRVTARISDESAKDFTVSTSLAVAKDLGTEFGVYVSPGRGVDLHVFEGLVEATILEESGQGIETIRLAANEGLHVSNDRQATSARNLENKFARSLDGLVLTSESELLVYEPFVGGDSEFLEGQAGGGGFAANRWNTGLSESLITRISSAPWVYPVGSQLAPRKSHFENRGQTWELTTASRDLAKSAHIDLGVDSQYFVSFLGRKFKHDSLGQIELGTVSDNAGIRLGWTYSGDADRSDVLAIGGIPGKTTGGPLENERVFLVVAQILARAQESDQVFLMSYDVATSRIEDRPPEIQSDKWQVVSTKFDSDDKLTRLSILSDGPGAYVQLDEIRIGSTWRSVTGGSGKSGAATLEDRETTRKVDPDKRK